MEVIFYAVTLIAIAALTGGGIAWLRIEFDLKPAATAAMSASVAMLPAAVTVYVGAGGEWALLFGALSALAVIDAKTRRIPREVTFPLIALGLSIGILHGLEEGTARLIGAAAGYGVFWLIGTMFYRLRGQDGLGLGDAALLGAIGAFMGWQALPDIVFVAALMGICIGVAAIMRGKVAAIPFAPPLALGTLVIYVVGPIFG